MSAHTPGPWKARRLNWQEWEIDAPSGDPTIGYSSWAGMISVYGCDDFPGAGKVVAEANARLIAAAPSLFAQLGDLVEIVEAAIAAGDWKVDGCCDPDLTLQKARVALAKAEGR